MTITAPESAPADSPLWEVIQLTRTSWRVCDAALTETDAARLVAYVDRNDTGRIDVLWLRSPCPTRSRYRDLDEMLADLDAAEAAELLPRASRPMHIPHFPPSR